MSKRFDPEEVARAHGESHLIPPNVRHLSAQEAHEVEVWADRVVKGREHRQQDFILIDYATETDPLLIVGAAGRAVELVHRFIEQTPKVDKAERQALWQKLTDAHLLLDRLQVVMLQMEHSHQQTKRKEVRKVQGAVDL